MDSTSAMILMLLGADLGPVLHHFQRVGLDHSVRGQRRAYQGAGPDVAPAGHLGDRQRRLQRVTHQLHPDLETLAGRFGDIVHHQGHRGRTGRVALLAWMVNTVHRLHQAAIRTALGQRERRLDRDVNDRPKLPSS